MSLKDCILRAVEGGEIEPDRSDRILRYYDEAFAELRKKMGDTQAEAQAGRVVVDRMKVDAAERRRVTQLAAAASSRQVERMKAHRNLKGELDPGGYAQDLISNKRGAGGSTLDGKYEAVRRAFRREMTDAIMAFRANLVGMRRNKDTLANVVREAFGENTGDAHAKAIAGSWAAVSEKARTRFNAAGGHIGKMPDKWGLPQSHDTAKVRKVGFEEWRAEILPRLDIEGMAEQFGEGFPITPEAFNEVLRKTWNAIRTDGYSKREASARYGSAIYNSRADSRFFKFKSGNDWIAYSERFGAGKDAFRVMLRHLDDMAMDIAMMEELGPNPSNTFRFLTDAAKKIAAESDDVGALEKAKRQVKTADDMMDLFTGSTNVPQSRKVARGAAALRNYLSSAHLGSAIISSATDFNTQRMAASFTGLRQSGPVRQLVGLMFSPEMRKNAQDAGLIFENAVDVGNAVARYELEDMHVEAAARLADFTIRASGLGWLTEIQKQAFGLEFMSTAARDWHGKAFDALEPRVQRTLKAYGIGAEDWAAISKAKIHETSNGLKILRAQEIEAVAGASVADRYMEAITSGTEFAIPSTDLFGKAVVLGRTRPGSVSGEMLRFGLQFKAFPVTMMVTQFGRIMQEAYAGRRGSAMSYAAGLMVGNTILGALALQGKEMSKGRDPRDMTTAEFWMAAFLQGGGAGIFGDFFFADQNRFGSGIAQTLAGPGVGAADDFLKFTVGNVQQLVRGDDTNAPAEFVNLLRRYTPGGSLWYLRLAYEREVLDQLQAIVDPNASRAFRRRVKSAQDQGSDYFAPPGQSLFGRKGIRKPDISGAFGK